MLKKRFSFSFKMKHFQGVDMLIERRPSREGRAEDPGEMIWGAENIPQPALLKLMILYTLDGCLRESLEVPKGSQATCSV